MTIDRIMIHVHCIFSQLSKYENQQRAITPKILKAELWFLHTALLLNEINPCMKFEVNTSKTFGVMLRTRIKYETNKRQ